MAQTIDRIRKVLARTHTGVLSTVTEDGKPWARYVALKASDDLMIRFATFRHSRKVAQVAHNPEVHLTCGFENPADSPDYLQIQGRATVSDEAGLRHSFWNDGLKEYFKGPDDPEYVVMAIKPYRIEYMSFEPSGPQVWEA